MKTLLYCNQDIFSGFCDEGSDVIMLGFPVNRKKWVLDISTSYKRTFGMALRYPP